MLVYFGLRTEHFDMWNAFLCRHLQELQTYNYSPFLACPVCLCYYCNLCGGCLLKDAEILKLEEMNRSLDEQLQSAMDDVGEKTTELETVSIEFVYTIIESVVTKQTHRAGNKST